MSMYMFVLFQYSFVLNYDFVWNYENTFNLISELKKIYLFFFLDHTLDYFTFL